MSEITPEDVNGYNQRGWLLKRSFLDPSQSSIVSQAVDELEVLPEQRGAHMVYYEPDLRDPSQKIVQRIEFFCDFQTELRSFVVGGVIQSACNFLLGEESVLFKEKVNFKHPGGSGFKTHQDQQAGWGKYAGMFISVLVAVDAAVIENGCLHIRDTERLTGLIGPQWVPLDDSCSPTKDLSPIEMEIGDVLFFDSYVVHGSGPNITSRARRNLYLTYNKVSDGDHRERYFSEKRAAFPPDIERDGSHEYIFKV